MTLKEGLNFSDYFDDSVPYEVKPVPSTIPMEEMSNSETDVDKFTFAKSIGYAWMDKNGNYIYDGSTHEEIAYGYLFSLSTKLHITDLYTQMYKLGFIKIVVDKREKIMFITYHNNKPTTKQLRRIKIDCIEHQWKLEDSVTHKEIDLNESLIPQKSPLAKTKDSSKNYGDDYPLRAKDLYKGLWEAESYITPGYDAYWLDVNGKFHHTRSHSGWAKMYLKMNGVDLEDFDGVYLAMYKKGFVRISIDTGDKVLHVDYGIKNPSTVKPNQKQWSEIMDLAIERRLSIYDDTTKRDVELRENLSEDVVQKDSEYWLDTTGRFNRTGPGGHQEWGMQYLDKNNIPYDHDPYRESENEQGQFGLYKTLFLKKFVRIVSDGNSLYAQNTFNPPTPGQFRKLIDTAKDSDLKLIVNGRRVDLYEIKHNNSDNRSLFIESMMPENMDTFKSHLVQLFAYLQKELQLKTVPSVKLISDDKNASKVLGKTAYYSPDEKLVVLYTTNRHQKDILRSFAHEIIHHWQHENEKFSESKGNGTKKDPKYAQNDPWLRQMEKQAYLLGNMLFRDWEDDKKSKDKKSGYDGKGRTHKKVKERTYSIGDEYPPKKMDYRG